MTDQFIAQETTTHEAISLLPEEIQDLLAEQALSELNKAKAVPFNPVGDAEKLDLIIEHTQAKIEKLFAIDVELKLLAEAETEAEVEKPDGEVEKIKLLNKPKADLFEVMAIEAKVAAAIRGYQTTLLNTMKAKRLLSGQLYGTRLAHQAQISRVKRVRQVSLNGRDLMQSFSQGATRSSISLGQEMERLPTPAVTNVVELFPKAPEAISMDYEPVRSEKQEHTDAVFTELAPSPVEKQTEQPTPSNTKLRESLKTSVAQEVHKSDTLLCSSWED